MADRDVRIGTGGMWLIDADGKPVDNFGGGGGGGTPLPEELVQGLQDALAGYQGSVEDFIAQLAGKQSHSANLDEFAGVDPSEIGKAIVAAANAAAVRAAIGAQDAASALSYRIGQRVDFLIGTPPEQRVGFLRAAGQGTLYNKADKPALAALLATTASPVAAFVKKYAPENYTTPNNIRPTTRLGTRLLHYAVAGSSSSYAHRSDDNGDNWVRVTTTNLYTQLGSVSPRFAVTFNNQVYLFTTGGAFISSADGLTGWSAVQQLNTVLGIAGISLSSVRVLDDRLWVCGSYTGGAVASFVAYMNAAGQWTRCNTPLNRAIVDVARKPNDTVVALGNGNSELCTSDDNGATWTARLFGLNVLEAMNVCTWVAHLGVFAFFGSSGRWVSSPSGKDNYVKGSASGFITTVNDVLVAEGQIILACSGTGLDGRGRLHISPDLIDWSFRLVAGSEEVTFVSQAYYSAGRVVLLHNGSGSGLGTWVISTSDIPSALAADKFYVPAGSPPPGWDTYVYAGQ